MNGKYFLYDSDNYIDICLCVSMRALPCVTTHMGTSEDNSEQLLLSLYCVASRNGTWVFRLGGKGLGLMFRLSSPLKLVLCHKLSEQ